MRDRSLRGNQGKDSHACMGIECRYLLFNVKDSLAGLLTRVLLGIENLSILRLSFLPHGLATRYLLEELESPRCYLSLVLFAFTCRFSASRYSGCLFDNILMLLGSSCT